MKQSESIAELLAALVEVQSCLPTMPKSSQAYGYKYTDLDTITQTIKPILSKNGIGYMQSVGGLAENALTLTTRIFNKKGEYIEDTAALPTITSTKNNAAQTLGMSITYMRRYALCAMLGITSDEDTDANTQDKPTPAPATGYKKTTPPPARQNQAPAAKQSQPPVEGMKKASELTHKGGESTKEEIARIKELLEAAYENGKPIFTRDEMKMYSAKRATEMTAGELIAYIENALRIRSPNAKELKKQATPAELAKSAAEQTKEPVAEKPDLF